ncbi:MAG: nuclear transport factor 2 family protein [Candidatus Binatia bacterium]
MRPLLHAWRAALPRGRRRPRGALGDRHRGRAPIRARAGALLLAALFAATGAAAEHPPGSVEQTQLIVDRFAARFAQVGPEMGAQVEDIYGPDVAFRDPVTRLRGLEALRRYLNHFGEVAAGARFTITGTIVQPGDAVVFWAMAPAGGGPAIEGVSHLRVRERVYEERDYFDLGDVYDRIPGLAWLTGLVKSRLAPAVE